MTRQTKDKVSTGRVRAMLVWAVLGLTSLIIAMELISAMRGAWTPLEPPVVTRPATLRHEEALAIPGELGGSNLLVRADAAQGAFLLESRGRLSESECVALLEHAAGPDRAGAVAVLEDGYYSRFAICGP